jgi:hypothetical protein
MQAAQGSTDRQELGSAGGSLKPAAISKELADEVMHVVINNIHEGREDRKLTTHQAAATFTSLCSLIATQNASASTNESDESCAGLDWHESAMKLLVVQPTTKKSRYSLLAVLVPYVSGLKMIRHHPTLVQECMHAMHADTCTVATVFLRELLSALREEIVRSPSGSACEALQGRTEEESASLDALKAQWRALWLQPVVGLLRGSDVTFRSRLVNYCLPMLLDLDPESLPDLLQLQVHSHGNHASSSTQQQEHDNQAAAIAGTIAVLSAARAMHLFDSLDAVVKDDADRMHVPQWLLNVAAVHKDESLRIQTLEVAALSVKSTSVCSPERHLLAWLQGTSPPPP